VCKTTRLYQDAALLFLSKVQFQGAVFWDNRDASPFLTWPPATLVDANYMCLLEVRCTNHDSKNPPLDRLASCISCHRREPTGQTQKSCLFIKRTRLRLRRISRNAVRGTGQYVEQLYVRKPCGLIDVGSRI
jgi:hypothetical protein